MGHRLIDDALEKQASKELETIDYVKVSYQTILNTPNDAKLGSLVRNTLYELQKNK
jgi:hypothetical protein